jgi:glutathione peroxidase
MALFGFHFGLANAEASMKSDEAQSGDFFSLSANSIDGKPISMSEYKGKVVLIVNTASKCGFTPQYEGLQALYGKYKDQGLVILGFPSNDFLWQEPGSADDIKKFCSLNYGVNFPLFEKNHVKGSKKQPIYKFLTEQSAKEFQGEVGWNFEKFLISPQGTVVGRFKSRMKPESDEITKKVTELLAQVRSQATK